MLLRILLVIFFIISINVKAEDLKKCKFKNDEGSPCLIITKTPNSSAYSKLGVNKIIITKEDIYKSGAIDTSDVLNLVSGLDVFQSGPKGQSTSIFTRGSESNHTLVMINGVAINDQSVTDGLHDFGQEFVQNINQIEIYKAQDGTTQINVQFEQDTVWLTQAQMAALFGKGRTTITEHIKNVFTEGELEEKVVCRDFRHTTQHGAIEGKKQSKK